MLPQTRSFQGESHVVLVLGAVEGHLQLDRLDHHFLRSADRRHRRVIGAFTQPKTAGEMVLTMDVRDGLPDQRPNNPFVDQHKRRVGHRRGDRAREG